MSDEVKPIHDFTDKALRDALTQPDNLKAFMTEIVPERIDRFQFNERIILPRNFLLDDWRDRESDLLIEVPYRGEVGPSTMMVSILLEHQSTEDPRMPLRTLLYTLLYWDRKWKDWEFLPPPRERFSLPATIPIVLYTGPGRWTTNRTLADLIVVRKH